MEDSKCACCCARRDPGDAGSESQTPRFSPAHGPPADRNSANRLSGADSLPRSCGSRLGCNEAGGDADALLPTVKEVSDTDNDNGSFDAAAACHVLDDTPAGTRQQVASTQNATPRYRRTSLASLSSLPHDGDDHDFGLDSPCIQRLNCKDVWVVECSMATPRSP